MALLSNAVVPAPLIVAVPILPERDPIIKFALVPVLVNKAPLVILKSPLAPEALPITISELALVRLEALPVIVKVPVPALPTVLAPVIMISPPLCMVVVPFELASSATINAPSAVTTAELATIIELAFTEASPTFRLLSKAVVPAPLMDADPTLLELDPSIKSDEAPVLVNKAPLVMVKSPLDPVWFPIVISVVALVHVEPLPVIVRSPVAELLP
jgi:hypothetical protein